MEIEMTHKEAELVVKLLKESLNPFEITAPEVVSDIDIKSIIKNIESAKRAEMVWNLLVVED